MRRAILPIIMASALALAIAGCGGGGATTSVNNLSVSADRTSIAYGESITLSWSSQDTDTSYQNGFDSCNFARVFDPLPLSGNVTDRPAITTTYRMQVRRAAGGTVERSVTVTVAPGTKKFLVVGESSSADRASALTLIPEITTVAPAVDTSIPAPSADFDAVVLCEGGAYGPADQSTLSAWLTAGKGVVVVGGAANQLATGDVNDPDTSAISSWFGGATTSTRLNEVYSSFTEPNESQIGTLRTNRNWMVPERELGRTVRWGSSWYEITNLSSAAVPQTKDVRVFTTATTSWSFVAGTGRVYFITGLTGPSVEAGLEYAQIREVFLPGIRWVSSE